MTFEEFKEKVDAIYSKVTPEELAAQLEELGYPIERIEEDQDEDFYFCINSEIIFDDSSADCYLPLAA